MSTNLLHLDSSILGAHSVSRSMSASVVARLTAADPKIVVTYRDLAATPVPHLTGAYLAAAQAEVGTVDAQMLEDLDLGRQVLDEFLAAEIVVLGLGFYNFTVPSQVKTWIDRLAIAGKTFRYTESGPQGLAGGKRVILAIARGGYFGPTSPVASFEHAETYLRNIFMFFGIPHIEVVVAEGMAVGPEVRAENIARAHSEIAALSI